MYHPGEHFNIREGDRSANAHQNIGTDFKLFVITVRASPLEGEFGKRTKRFYFSVDSTRHTRKNYAEIEVEK